MTHESLYKRAEEAQRLAEAASDGPWRWQANPKHKSISLVGGRPTYDLTVMDFVRWGMSGAAPRFRDLSERGLNLMNQVRRWFVNAPKREHHADWFQFVDHPDANLIAAAPSHVALIGELVEALKAAERDADAKQAEIDRLMWEHDPDSMTGEQIARWEAAQVEASPEDSAAITLSANADKGGEDEVLIVPAFLRSGRD